LSSSEAEPDPCDIVAHHAPVMSNREPGRRMQALAAQHDPAAPGEQEQGRADRHAGGAAGDQHGRVRAGDRQARAGGRRREAGAVVAVDTR
jgi:hypothetical protein